MTWPGYITVAVPTIAERAPLLAQGCARWRALGASPVVILQPPRLPLGGASQTMTALAAIRAALRRAPAATHVLYAEDDAIPSPLLPGLLEGLAATGEAVTLWSSAFTFLPAPVRRGLRAGEPLPGHQAVRAVGLSRWFGTVAVLLPASDAAAVTERPPEPGFDNHLRSWLLATGAPLLIAVPNLAQHARGKRYATRGGPAVVESGTFGWPVSGEAPC